MTAAWFLVTESGQPLGMWLQERADPAPVRGERLQGDDGWQEGEVVEFQEMPRACSMRRYRVVIRIVREGKG